MLSKAMFAIGVSEREVETMSDGDISEFMEDQSKHRFDATIDMAG